MQRFLIDFATKLFRNFTFSLRKYVAQILKIFAVILMYTLTAAIIEPFTEKRIVVCINDTGGALKILLGCVLGVEVMFLISVVTMMKMANMSMMLR